MPFNANEVIAGRNFRIYSAPYNTSNSLPPDSTDYGTDWPSPWVNLGYTSGGLQLQVNVEYGEIRVDQEFDPVFMPITQRSFQLSCELAQVTAQNLLLASGVGQVTQVAPTATARGHDDYELRSTVQPLFRSWGYDILQPDAMPFRVFVPKGMATGSPQIQFTADNAATIQLQVTALVDTDRNGLIAIVRDVLPPTA